MGPFSELELFGQGPTLWLVIVKNMMTNSMQKDQFFQDSDDIS
jgi:hypothetical protein